MSMNMPVTGGSFAGERYVSAEPVQTPKSPETSTPAASAATPESTAIPSFVDLKQAKLIGENVTLSDDQVMRAIEKVMKALQGKTTNLQFSFHEKTKTIAVKVIDAETKEVIREIPPEKTLDMVAKMWELAGLFIDEKR